jgi:ELWxxDGT repeat protein
MTCGLGLPQSTSSDLLYRSQRGDPPARRGGLGLRPRPRQPWVTDGTAKGTRRLLDIVPGAIGSGPDAFTRFGDRAFFSAVDDHRYTLWITDDTPDGTFPTLDLSTNPRALSPTDAIACARLITSKRLYFTLTTDYHTALWAVPLASLRDATRGDPRHLTDAGAVHLLTLPRHEDVSTLLPTRDGVYVTTTAPDLWFIHDPAPP